MEDKGLAEEQTNEQSSYSIIWFQGQVLPDQYKPMVYSKWLRGTKFSNNYFRLIDSDAFFEVYQKYITVILNRPNTKVKLAILPDDKDIVLGFSVIEGSILHYVYVHKDNREIGIARALLPKDFKYITHLTKMGLTIWANKYPQVKFNPFM